MKECQIWIPQHAKVLSTPRTATLFPGPRNSNTTTTTTTSSSQVTLVHFSLRWLMNFQNFQDLGKPTGELKIMEMHNYSLQEDVTQQSGLTFGRAVVFSERTWLKQRSFNSRLQRLGIHVNHPGPSFLPCFRRLRCQRVNRRRPRPGLRVGLHGDSPTTNALINTARQPHTHTHVPEYVGNATATPYTSTLHLYSIHVYTHTCTCIYAPQYRHRFLRTYIYPSSTFLATVPVYLPSAFNYTPAYLLTYARSTQGQLHAHVCYIELELELYRETD